MENSDQIVTLFIKDGISLNTNILETGLINNLVLVIIVFYTSRNLIIPALQERKETIVKDLQKVKEQLKAARKRLDEAEKKAEQADMAVCEIKEKALANKISFLESETLKSKKDLAVRFDQAVETLSSKERKIVIEIKQQIISLVLEQTVKRAQKTFKSKKRSRAFINEAIGELFDPKRKGDLL